MYVPYTNRRKVVPGAMTTAGGTLKGARSCVTIGDFAIAFCESGGGVDVKTTRW